MIPANSSAVSVPPTAPGESVKRLLPWLVAVAFFMESLDTTILNTAVPAIAQALAVAPLSMKAVLSSYTLSLALFIPISGWMADRFGTRRVFASAIGLFTLGSILCGVSSDIHVLVACRILQGCGGAMMLPVGRLTMVRAFAKSELSCRSQRGTGQRRQHHREHDAADVDQFRRGDGVAGHGVLHSRPFSHQRAGNDSRHPPGVPRPGRLDRPLRHCLPRIEKR